MAYMTQEMKKDLSVNIKKVLKKYKVKASISVRHYSTLVVKISESPIDFQLRDTEDGYRQVNEFYIDKNYQGIAKDFLNELISAMNCSENYQNHNRSDIMRDYFGVGWYTDINIGQWNKPYKLTIQTN